MTAPLKNIAPTPLETEYKELLNLSPRSNKPLKRVDIPSGLPRSQPEDFVTLSGRPDAEGSSVKLTPSQPVTKAERQALQSQFSIYG